MDWDYKTNGHFFFNDSERGASSCDIEFQKGHRTEAVRSLEEAGPRPQVQKVWTSILRQYSTLCPHPAPPGDECGRAASADSQKSGRKRYCPQAKAAA